MGVHGPEFFETRMGRTFIEGTMPKLIKVLERIAAALEQSQTDDDTEEES